MAAVVLEITNAINFYGSRVFPTYVNATRILVTHSPGMEQIARMSLIIHIPFSTSFSFFSQLSKHHVLGWNRVWLVLFSFSLIKKFIRDLIR